MRSGKQLTHIRRGIYERYIKRPLDFMVALCTIIILSPVLLLIAILVKVKLGSPVIYVQKRPGLNEKIFNLYKFRTMTDKKDKDGNLLSDEERLTEFGKKLRKTSLDELPELWNILLGDMSIVGPRPQLVKDMVFMTREQRKRHIVRPGLTGLAQVNGRNVITWEKKFLWDLKYIDKITFLGDIRIIFKTIWKVSKRADINREGTASDMDFGDYLLHKGEVEKKEYDKKQEEAKKLMEKMQRNS